MNSLLHDNLAGIRQIKTYVREDEEHRRFNARQRPAARGDAGHHADVVGLQSGDEFLHQRRARAGAPVRRPRGGGGPDRTRRLHGRAAAGGFLYEPIRQLHSLNQLIQAGRAAGGRVFEIMDTPPEAADEIPPHEPGRAEAAGIVGRREVRQRRFLPTTRSGPCSRTSRCTRRPGRRSRWSGRPARGNPRWSICSRVSTSSTAARSRSTAARCTEIPRAQLRAAVGLVTQESFLFNGTVRDNLRLGRPGRDGRRTARRRRGGQRAGVHRADARRAWARSSASAASS